MALFNCPICNGAVSEEAVSCPHCGHPNPVDQSMIEARRREEDRRQAEIQRQAALQGNRQPGQQMATNAGSEAPPSGFRKLCPILAIVCALIGTLLLLVSVFFEFPQFDFWWERMAIDRFLYFFITGTIPFFLAQALMLFANLQGKTKLWSGAGLLFTLAGSCFYFLNLTYFNLFHYQYVMEKEWDSSWWLEWKLNAIFWHGGDFLFLLGTALLVAACLSHKNKVFAILSIPLVLLCFLVAFEKILTFQFEDPFGRLSNDLGFLNKSFWVIDSVLWMLVIILCAISTMTCPKATAGKE